MRSIYSVVNKIEIPTTENFLVLVQRQCCVRHTKIILAFGMRPALSRTYRVYWNEHF